jgi:hypothetical protein
MLQGTTIVARPEGLEPPAYWFEAENQRNISNLAQKCAERNSPRRFSSLADDSSRNIAAIVPGADIRIPGADREAA